MRALHQTTAYGQATRSRCIAYGQHALAKPFAARNSGSTSTSVDKRICVRDTTAIDEQRANTAVPDVEFGDVLPRAATDGHRSETARAVPDHAMRIRYRTACNVERSVARAANVEFLGIRPRAPSNRRRTRPSSISS